MTIRVQIDPLAPFRCQCGHMSGDHAGASGRRGFQLNADRTRGACRECDCTRFEAFRDRAALETDRRTA